jgi:hypothetical protein
MSAFQSYIVREVICLVTPGGSTLETSTHAWYRCMQHPSSPPQYMKGVCVPEYIDQCHKIKQTPKAQVDQ